MERILAAEHARDRILRHGLWRVRQGADIPSLACVDAHGNVKVPLDPLRSPPNADNGSVDYGGYNYEALGPSTPSLPG